MEAESQTQKGEWPMGRSSESAGPKRQYSVGRYTNHNYQSKNNPVASMHQKRGTSSRVEDTTIYRTPVTLETLLQSFTRRNFLNVTGEAPSLHQMQEDVQDVQGAEVTMESKPPTTRPDTWRLDEGPGGGMLERMKPHD